MKLMKLAEGKVLHFPEFLVGHLPPRIWLREGGVVDVDDKFIAHAIRGQEYKLEPAPEATEATPLTEGRMLRQREAFYGRLEAKKVPTMQERATEKAGEVSEKEPVIPTPDLTIKPTQAPAAPKVTPKAPQAPVKGPAKVVEQPKPKK